MRSSQRVRGFAPWWVLLLAPPLCAVADPPPITAVKADISFEWSQVTRQQATVVIGNAGADPRDIQVKLLSSGAVQDLVRVTPEKLKIPSHGDAMLGLSANLEKEGIGAPFDAMLQIVDENGSLLTSTRISIAADVPIPAVTSLKRLAMKPLSGEWTLSLSVPLRNSFPPGYVAKANEVVGYLLSTDGRTLPVRFDRLKSIGGTLLAQYQIDAMQSGGFTGSLYFDPQKAGTAFSLTIDSQDNVLFAILDIAAGIALAALVKNYLSNRRVLWLIKREALGIPDLMASARAEFHRQVPRSSFDPTADLSRQKDALSASLRQFGSWKRSMVDNRTWFNDRLQDIKSIESQLNDWVDLGYALSAMHNRIQTVTTVCGGFANGSEPLWMIDARLAFDGGVIRGAELAKAIQDANSSYDFAGAWLAVFEYWDEVSAKVPAVAAMKPDIFAAETNDALGAVKARIYAAAQVGAQAADARGGFFSLTTSAAGGAGNGATGGLRRSGDSVEDRRARLTLLVRSGDAASFLFSVALAILSSLGAYYFGKAFGSWPDYLALFIAAAGVKAGVDLIVSFADKFAGVAAARVI